MGERIGLGLIKSIAPHRTDCSCLDNLDEIKYYKNYKFVKVRCVPCRQGVGLGGSTSALREDGWGRSTG